MGMWTLLNLEQSVARYLADQLKSDGFNIKWVDTHRIESVSGAITVSILREFPEEVKNFAKQDGPSSPGIVNTPAFSVYAASPSTSASTRQGIGEGVFEWQMALRIDGFVDDEWQWYQFATRLKNWFSHPDIRISLYDYEADLTSNSPTLSDQTVMLVGTDIARIELIEQPAARYYLNVTTTAVFVE